jgi:hypothetical protein
MPRRIVVSWPGIVVVATSIDPIFYGPIQCVWSRVSRLVPVPISFVSDR